MISFVLKGGLDESARFLSACQIFTLAESLGGVPLATRNQLGIVDGFIRLSVGIEDISDLQGDLDRAFHAAT